MAAKQHDRANRQVAEAMIAVFSLAKEHVDIVTRATKPALKVSGNESHAMRALIDSFVKESFSSGGKSVGLPYAQHAMTAIGSSVAWIGVDNDAVDDTTQKLIATIESAVAFAPQCTAVALPIVDVLQLVKARLIDAMRAKKGESLMFTALVPGEYFDAAKREGSIGDVGRDGLQRFGEILRIADGRIDGAQPALMAAEKILQVGRPQLDSIDEKILKNLSSGGALLRQIMVWISRSESPTRKRLQRLMDLDPPRVERPRRGFYCLPKR